MKLFLAAVALMVATSVAVQVEESSALAATESASMTVMSKLGLRDVQEQVDKDLWQARQAQSSADDEDEEIARLLAELEGLDAEKAAAEKEAKQKEIEAKEATAAKLKEVAKQKFEFAKSAIDAKAKRVEEVALKAQATAEDSIEKVKKLRADAAAAMAKAKMAAEEYQNALTAGMTEKAKELEVAAKKATEEAEDLAKRAGIESTASTFALRNAAEVKASADRAIKLEKETRGELMEEGLQWVAGPIFDKMKKLCDLDYPTFRKEYRKIRESPSYKPFRWDIKKACPKAASDDLESMNSEEEEAARLAAEQAAALNNVHAPPQDTSKPFPHSNTHWSLPKSGEVKKWCTTQYGAVPCSMLKKAKEAGLLGDIKVDDESKRALSMLELDDTEVQSIDDTTGL
jgi:colicin import membrane protein